MATATKRHLATTLEMARLFGVKPLTIFNWRKRGMPCIFLSGGAKRPVRFPIPKVFEWVLEHKGLEPDEGALREILEAGE